MTGKTHKAVGVCVGIAFTYWGIKTYGDPTFAISTIASAAGAMLPDIDHNNSKLGSQRKAVVSVAAKILSALFGIVILALSATLAVSKLYTQLIIMLLLIILPVIALSLAAQISIVRKALKFSVKHRGIMHTLAIPLLLCLGFMLISNDAFRFGLLAMSAGYMSHLLLDCLNKRGCPILWPVIPKNISLLSIKTGSKAEYVVSYTLTGILLLAFFMYQTVALPWKIPANNDSALILVLDDVERILTWYDGCAGYYSDTLDAIAEYVGEPTENNLLKAETVCSEAIKGIESLTEITHLLDDKTISEMSALKIDVVDFYGLFNTQAFTKNDYITSISQLVFYISHAPALDSELKQTLIEKQAIEAAFRKINYIGVNQLLSEIDDDKLLDFKAFLTSLKTFSKDGLPWEKDKDILELKVEALFADAEKASDEYAGYLAEEYTRLLQNQENYKAFLMEYDFTEDEANERIKEISILSDQLLYGQ